MAKPSSKLDWTVGNPDIATTTVEPDPSKKQTGWAVDERPGRQYFNWLFWIIDQWIKYFNTIGVPEWDATTTYQVGSVVNNGAGVLFRSIQSANLNHAVTNGSWWVPATSGLNTVVVDPAVTPIYTLTSADIGRTFLVKSANGGVSFALLVQQNFSFTVKDRDGYFSTYPCTFTRAGSESFEGLAANFIAEANFGIYSPFCDGTDHYLGD